MIHGVRGGMKSGGAVSEFLRVAASEAARRSSAQGGAESHFATMAARFHARVGADGEGGRRTVVILLAASLRNQDDGATGR